MKKKKLLYMKRTMVLAVIAGYIGLLVLLLFTSWIQISNYQKDKKRSEMQALEHYVSRVEEAMTNIDRHIYDVYAYNKNFQELSQILSPIENYQNAYELKETMDNKRLIEEDLHGYYIYYDRLSKSWYKIDNSKIDAETANKINEELRMQAEYANIMRNWSVISYNEDIILSITCRKGNVAIAGLHSLGDASKQLEENLDKDMDVVLINEGLVIKGENIEDSIEIRDKIKESIDSFQGKVGKNYVYASRIEKTNLWVCMALKSNLLSIMTVQQLLLLIVTAISIIAVALIYVFLRKEFIFPLRELTAIMNQIRLGEIYSVPKLDVRFRELNDVNETLASMVSEIEKQKLLVYEEIIEKQKAQMQYLQLQLKPHFYLNSLKTLNNMASRGDTENMQELIFALSTHMRYLLQMEQETIQLNMEIEFVKNYIILQKYTGRKIEYEIEIDELVKYWTVPVLCVQTFVENSIKYARLGSSDMTLHLSVKGALLSIDGKQYLDLTIRDNGQGFPKDVLGDINSEDTAGRSVGIYNIKRRCLLLYGEEFESEFYNYNGAVAELIIPNEVIK